MTNFSLCHITKIHSFSQKNALKRFKIKSPSELLKIGEELKIENAGTLRKQDMIFAILKQMAQNKDAIYGRCTRNFQDGFGFLDLQTQIIYLVLTTSMFRHHK